MNDETVVDSDETIKEKKFIFNYINSRDSDIPS